MNASAWQRALSLLLPSACYCCESDLPAVPFYVELGLCASCREDIRWCTGCDYLEDSALDAIYASAEFSGGLRDSILHFKYHRRDFLARDLARAWIERTPFEPDDYDAIVAIPMATLKSLGRGYNPAAEVAAVIAAEHHRPLLAGALRRNLFSTSQTDKNKPERFLNAQKGFSLGRAGERARGLSVLLVDDVCTTGATLDACARLLKQAGARRVLGAAIARDMLA